MPGVRSVAATLLVCLAAAGCSPEVELTTDAPATPTTVPAAAPTTAPEPTAPAIPTLVPSVSACDLVTQAEADATAGTPLDAGVVADSADVSTCTFTGPVTGPTAQLEVFVGAGAQKIYDIDVQLGHEFSTVPGVGDEAFEEDFAIFVRADTTWLAVRLVRLDEPSVYRQALRDLAVVLVSRL